MGKKYSEEFKNHIVKEYAQGRSYASLSSEYGVSKSTISDWVNQNSKECQETPNLSTLPNTAKECHELQKRIAELEKENLFLKKAAAFFAKEIG